MEFKVCRGKETLMSTNDVSAIYNVETLMSMSRAGYTFKLDGKSISAKALIELLKGMK